MASSNANIKNFATRMEVDGFAVAPSSTSVLTASYITDADFAGVKYQAIESKNMRFRDDISHNVIIGQNKGEGSFSKYWHRNPSAANASAAATLFDVPEYNRNYMGGCDLGWRPGGLLANTGSTLQLSSGASLFVQGDDVWLTDTGDLQDVPQCYEVYFVNTSTNQLVLDRTPHFTVGAADTINASITNFFYQQVYSNWSTASHITHTIYEEGDESLSEYLGCKFNLDIPALEEGKETMGTYAVMITAGDQYTGSLGAMPNLGSEPTGRSPVVAGKGRTSFVRMAPVGSPLADVEVIGGIKPLLGLANGVVNGTNGVNGNRGFVGKLENKTGAQFNLPYSSSYTQQFRASTHVHLLINMGGEFDLYFPELQIAEDPVREANGNVETVNLVLHNATRTAAASGSLGEADANKWRSPVKIRFRS